MKSSSTTKKYKNASKCQRLRSTSHQSQKCGEKPSDDVTKKLVNWFCYNLEVNQPFKTNGKNFTKIWGSTFLIIIIIALLHTQILRNGVARFVDYYVD